MKILYLLILVAPLSVLAQKKKKDIAEYIPPANTCTTTKSYDEVWSKIVGQLSAYGIPIHTIDKSSGVITSNKFNFIQNEDRTKRGVVKPGKLWTYQKKEFPINTSAWVMLYMMNDKLYPVSITGDINIIVKQEGGSVSVTANISNISAESNNDRDKWRYYRAYTTGVLENSIIEKVK